MKRRCAVSAHTRALLLGMLTLVVSVLCIAGCKHPTTDTKPEDLSVTVTVKGDRHITVHEPQRFTVPTGTAWRTVQEKIHIAVESGYEHTGWKLESIIGMDLTDDYVFNESKTVFAVSKRIGSVSPEKITVTLAADAGYTVNDAHTYEVPLGTMWNDIKETAQKAVTLKAGYDALGWKLENAGGADITDSMVFIKNGTVIAVSKLHGAPAPEKITITVQGDSNLSVSSDNTFTVDKQTLWQNIRAAVESKVTAHAGYELAEWRLNTEAGSVLTGEYGFTGDTVVFAVSRQEEDEPSGPIDPAIFKTDGHGTIIGYTCAKEALPKILVIPDKIGDELITKIGEKAFFQTDIKKLDMSQMSSLKTIENLAFCGCHNLKNIKFPVSLERIEDGELDTDPVLLQPYWYTAGVFSNCENIAKVEFPKGSHLSYIGSAAFQDCFYGIDYYPARYPENRGLPNIDLSNCTMLTEIGNAAFSSNYLLQEIKLPPSITSLGRRVFELCGVETDNGIAELDLSACTSLKTLHRALFWRVKIKILKLPTSIETIEDGYVQAGDRVGVFQRCHIEVIDLSACTNLTRIGKWAFFGAKIKEVKLPPTIETIALEAFRECTNLSGTFTFPAALKTIEERAFWGCSGIASLNFSACIGLETIGQSAFLDCTGITGAVTFPAGLKTIGKYAFSSYDRQLQLRGIQGLDFSACTQLETIDEGAFKGCSGLTSINLTGCGIKTIGKEAFFCCTGLPALGLSGCNRLETIGEAAFTGCANIAGAIVFPATLKKIAEDAFSFGFHSGEPGYAALTKITALDFSACAQLETIDEDAFKDCSGITSINFIGCGVKTIGGAAFSRCTGLPALDLSGCTRLETIGHHAFSGCVNIAGTVAFPATLKKIEAIAFSDAQGYSDSSALTKITAVDFSRCSLLEEIGSGAFACCSGITGTLTLPASLKNLAENAFGRSPRCI